MIREDEQLGVLSVQEAQRLADEADLDLVEIAPNASPPVVKIMDYGKFKYEQAKRERESRKGSKQIELREVRMRVKIDKHDLDLKVRTARKLLLDGDKVKMSVMFRAREITHPEVGRELLERCYAQLEEIADLERPPQMEGRFMTMTLDPAKKAAARARDEKKSTPAADDSAATETADERETAAVE